MINKSVALESIEHEKAKWKVDLQLQQQFLLNKVVKAECAVEITIFQAKLIN